MVEYLEIYSIVFSKQTNKHVTKKPKTQHSNQNFLPVFLSVYNHWKPIHS